MLTGRDRAGRLQQVLRKLECLQEKAAKIKKGGEASQHHCKIRAAKFETRSHCPSMQISGVQAHLRGAFPANQVPVSSSRMQRRTHTSAASAARPSSAPQMRRCCAIMWRQSMRRPLLRWVPSTAVKVHEHILPAARVECVEHHV